MIEVNCISVAITSDSLAACFMVYSSYPSHLFFLYQGVSSQLQALVQGESNRDTPCVGENITYICTVPALSHAWSVPQYGVSATISVQTSSFDNKNPQFTMRLVTHSSNAITSSLSVIVFTDLNGTRITCTDSITLKGESQEITVEILGKMCAL